MSHLKAQSSSAFSRVAQMCAVALIAFVACAAQNAAAQGTSGMFPGPISTAELQGYADRLKLSEQQRQASHMIHDQYKQDFRALRQGDIKGFLDEMRSMQGDMMMPSRASMEAILKRMDQLNSKIATLDNRLFDQLQAMLTEDQLAMVSRVRLARQRVRYAANQMMGATGSQAGSNVDLSQILLDMKLADDVAQTIDPVLGQYESRLTTAIGKLHEQVSSMMMTMFEKMEEMGFTEQSMTDPETAGKLGEAMQEIWTEVTREMMKASQAIAELNKRTFKSLSPMLPEEESRRFRHLYFNRAYPQAGAMLRDDEPFFTAALKAQELTDDQRNTITAARQTLRQQVDQLVEEVVVLIEEHEKNFSPFDFDSSQMQEHYRKLGEYQAKYAEARKTATDAVTAALGTELARKIGLEAIAQAEPSGGVMTAPAPAQVVATDDDDGDEQAQSETYQMWSGDQFVPAPIGRAEINDYATMLGLNDEQKAVLTQLHATYTEKHKAVQDNQIAALTKSVQEMWKHDEATNQSVGPTRDTIDRTYRLRQEAIQAMRSLDEEFFNDIALAVIDDDAAPTLDRVRQMRWRAGYNRGQEMMWGFTSGSSEGKIDLATFIRQQRLNESDLAAINDELVKYEAAATEAFRARFEVSLEMQKAQEMWQVAAMEAQGESAGNAMRFAARYEEIMGDVSRRMGESNKAVTQLNRETIERILTTLPAATAATVRHAFNVRAFPSIYSDGLSIETQLTQALNLSELGPEQRRRISDLASEYRPAYARLCDQMVEVSAAPDFPMWSPGDTENWRKWQERQEALASLKFDRNELSLRAIAQMKSILSEVQIKLVGGLPDPSRASAQEAWYEQ